MIEYSDYKCKYLSLSEIKMKTDSFREKYWKENTLPIDMEKIIEKRMGLDIIPESDIKTVAYLKGDLSGIVVDITQYMDDQNRYSNRLRFSFAHEIGHYILHQAIYDLFKIETEEDYLLFIENIPDDEYASFEWQANEFSGSLLVPREKLIIEVQKIYDLVKRHNLEENFEREPMEIIARVSQKLCKPFGVSTVVIERRVNIEKLLPMNKS